MNEHPASLLEQFLCQWIIEKLKGKYLDEGKNIERSLKK